MPGRQRQGNDPWDSLSGEPLAPTNGTGKQRALPRRPSGIARVDRPPQTPRVGRPQRQAPPPKRWRRRLLILGVVFLACGLLAWGIGYAVVNYFIGLGISGGAASTSSDFLTNIATQNYDQAYKDLDATITLQLSPQDFKMEAQEDDHCYGTVTNFSEVAGSATISADNATESFAYMIIRSQGKTYQLHLTLHKDNYGNWYITSYGSGSGTNDLAPGLPPCSS